MTDDEFTTIDLDSGGVVVGLRLPNSGEAILLSEADAEWLSNKLQDLGFGDRPYSGPSPYWPILSPTTIDKWTPPTVSYSNGREDVGV